MALVVLDELIEYAHGAAPSCDYGTDHDGVGIVPAMLAAIVGVRVMSDASRIESQSEKHLEPRRSAGAEAQLLAPFSSLRFWR